MISPPGSFVLDMDTALSGRLDAMLAASVATAQGPALAAVALHFMGRGLSLGTGASRPWNPAADIPRIAVLLALTIRIDLLNTWVRDLFFRALPDTLMASYAGQGGAVSISSTSAAAAAFNAIWAQTGIIIAQALAQSPLGVLDLTTNTVAELCHVVAGFFLMLMAVTYVIGKLLLGIAVVFSPYVFALAIHPFFEGLLQRWVGLALAYIGMLASVVIMLQIVISGDQSYLDRIIEAQRAYETAVDGMAWYNVPGRVGAANAAMATTLTNLVGMALWVTAGAIATASVGVISFSLFGGLMPRTQPSLLGPVLAAREVARMVQSIRHAGPSGPGGGSPSGPSISPIPYPSPPSGLLAGPGRIASGRGMAALPPPPPLHTRG